MANTAVGAARQDEQREMNRNERKFRKIFEKCNLKTQTGIVGVVFKKNNQVLFTVDNPEIQSLVGDASHLIFGTAHASILASPAWKDTAAKLKNIENDIEMPDNVPEVVPVDDEEEVDETITITNVEEADHRFREEEIELLMTQTSCTRATAIKELKAHDGDIVKSIIALTNIIERTYDE